MSRIDQALETIQKGIEEAEKAYNITTAESTEKNKVAYEALQAALSNRDKQLKNVQKRIDELQAEVNAANEHIKELAADTSAAYGRNDITKAELAEKELREAQQRRDALKEQIKLMGEVESAVQIPADMVQAAKHSYKDYKRHIIEGRDQMAVRSSAIETLISQLTSLKDRIDNNLSWSFSHGSSTSSLDNALIEIVEHNEGPLDVRGHSCGLDHTAKLRYCTGGPSAPGLERTALASRAS